MEIHRLFIWNIVSALLHYLVVIINAIAFIWLSLGYVIDQVLLQLLKGLILFGA